MPTPSSQPLYAVHQAHDVMIPMRDGVRLATDIYRPAHGNGRPIDDKVPVLLVRTSYDKSAPEWDDVWPYYARRGYAFVVQDLRSRYRSEGDGKYYHTCNPWEGKDGYDTVEWLAAQPWCNGRVGTLGSSHRAITQTLLALERPPHLAAMWVEAGPTNIYAHEAREGGAMSFQMFAAAHLHALDCHEIRHDKQKARMVMDAMRDMNEWIKKFPLKPGETALRAAPSLEETVFNYYLRGDYDEWWDQECNNQEPYFDRHADVPMVIAGGWYDNFVGATANYYVEMKKRLKSPVRLIIGPWCHGGMRAEWPSHGKANVGWESVWGNAVYNPERLKWFDRWLKDNPAQPAPQDDPEVRIYVMGTGDGHETKLGDILHGGFWRNENEWPIKRARTQTLYMHGDGLLSGRKPNANAKPLTYTYDPENPVPTVGGLMVGGFEFIKPENGGPPRDFVPEYLDQWALVRANLTEAMPAGGWDQRDEHGNRLADRPDVLAFETAPLAADTEVTGAVNVTLFVSSTAVDTDFTVKLVDVYPPNDSYPNGFELILTDTIRRMRYRDSWTDPELMTPGEVYEVTIPLWPTSNVFKKGHKIALHVSSSNFPHFDVNPNTGEPMGRHTYMVKADNTVYVDAARLSRIEIPVIPARR